MSDPKPFGSIFSQDVFGPCRYNMADSLKPLSRIDASNLEKAHPQQSSSTMIEEYDNGARK